MTILPEQLQYLASLAYLDPDPDTAGKLSEDLSSIMDFVTALRKIDTKNVQPLTHPIDTLQRLRPDEAKLCNVTQQLAKIAPQFSDSLYLVPKVIK